jgi:hypothetical protein
MSDATRSQRPKLLDDVRKVLRLHYYSRHTERSYVEWIVRFVRFYGMRLRADLFLAAPKIDVFLTDLAVHEDAAATTQNQALNALGWLSKRVLNHPSGSPCQSDKAPQRPYLPACLWQSHERYKEEASHSWVRCFILF